MYRKILVALENGKADSALVPHVRQLALALKSELLLVHVADGWAARNFDQLKLAESEEMRADRAYLDQMAGDLRAGGLTVTPFLALGSPPVEILKATLRENCDLIAMGSHGHRYLGDVIHGSTISDVRHKATVPVLIVQAAGR